MQHPCADDGGKVGEAGGWLVWFAWGGIRVAHLGDKVETCQCDLGACGEDIYDRWTYALASECRVEFMVLVFGA